MIGAYRELINISLLCKNIFYKNIETEIYEILRKFLKYTWGFVICKDKKKLFFKLERIKFSLSLNRKTSQWITENVTSRMIMPITFLQDSMCVRLYCLQSDSKITSTSLKSIPRKCHTVYWQKYFQSKSVWQKNKNIQPGPEKVIYILIKKSADKLERLFSSLARTALKFQKN